MASPSVSPGTRPNISVSVGPGLKAFSRIFLSASSALMVLAKLESPALIADMMLVVGQAVLTVTDELFPTNRGICFSLKDNSNGLKALDSGTVGTVDLNRLRRRPEPLPVTQKAASSSPVASANFLRFTKSHACGCPLAADGHDYRHSYYKRQS